MRARLRPILAVAVAAVVAGCSAAPASSPTMPSSVTPSVAPGSVAPSATARASSAPATVAASPASTPLADALLAATLVDVRDGSSFTLAGLIADAPVIVETMAIWCTNCRAQMREVTAAHALADFHSVSIDVDPTEIAGDLADYAAREGFDWPFVLADAALATMLRERFGNEVLLPPGMPKLLVRTDGSVELLPIGQLLSAQQVADAVGG